jgi:hypothetical protein
MRRLLWPCLLLLAFGIGLLTGWGRGERPLQGVTPPSGLSNVVALQARIDTLQEELATKEAALVDFRQAALSQAKQPMSSSPLLIEPSSREAVPSAAQERHEKAPESETNNEQPDTPEPQEVVWERFYQFLDTTAGMSWGQRRRHERTMVAELQALGEPAVEAMLQLLQDSTDTRERSTAAFLLGSLQDQRAVPILQEMLANEDDIVLRRAAARGMARVQTPDTIPILDSILANGQEDRYMRLSAAYGLARMGESQGIDGLGAIFDESNADGRGHYLAFRALVAMDDARALPVMRKIAVSELEVSYRMGAIRFLGAHGDQEALPLLQQVIDASDEQQSVREAAEEALVAIRGGR